MLVLTRKKGERLMIGDDIVVTVIDVRGDGVRIGFDAPRGVKIQRAEVVAAVRAANTDAAASAAETQDLLVGLLNRTRRAPEEPVAPSAEQVDAARADEPARVAEVPAVEGSDRAGRPTAGSPKPGPRKPRT